MVVGGVEPSEVLHHFGAGGEFGVPVWHGLVSNTPHNRSLRVRVETLSGNGDDDWFASFLFAEAAQFNTRLALEAEAGYGTSWGTSGTAHGLTLGVGLPITLATRMAMVPRLGAFLLLGGELGFYPVATLSLNLRLRL
jgi:hypothetical protein